MNGTKIGHKKRGPAISFYVIIGLFLISIVFGILYTIISSEIEKQKYPRIYSEFVQKYSDAFGVPESIIYAVLKAESDFDKNAVSSSDPPALGLMQLTEETYEWVSSYLLKETVSAFSIYDPDTNIRNGTRYLAYLYGRFENWDTAFAAYNAGPGNVKKWLEDPECSDDGKTLKYIPFKETRNYVKRVNNFKKHYDKLYYSK